MYQQGASQLVTRSTHHTVKILWRVDRRDWRHCDELTVLFDLAFVAFKSFAIVREYDIAHSHTLNPDNQTELHGIVYVLLYARLR